MKNYPFLLSTIAVLTLTHCGGNTDSSSSPSPIQGVFLGASVDGTNLTNIVLADGSFFGLYGTISQGTFQVEGLNTGNFIAANGAYRVTYVDFAVPGDNPITHNDFGNYTTTSLSGTFTENGVPQSFKLNSPPISIYNYHTPALISSVIGSWSGSLLNGDASTLDILDNGTFSGTTSTGCAYTGTLVPESNGVNIFNVMLNFGAAPCFIPNQTASGIAVTFSTSDGNDAVSTHALFFAATTPNFSAATAFYAER